MHQLENRDVSFDTKPSALFSIASYKWLFTSWFLLFPFVSGFPQKEIKIQDQQLSLLTIQTEKAVKYKVKERLFLLSLKKFKHSYYLPNAPAIYYVGKRRRLYDNIGGRNDRSWFGGFFFRLIGSVNYLLGTNNYKFYMHFYGLKSNADQKELLPTVYTRIDTMNKEVYLLQQWDDYTIYFRKSNQLTPLKWDRAGFCKTAGMIVLSQGDTTCLLDYNGNIRVKMTKKKITLEKYGAIVSDTEGLTYIDTNFQVHQLHQIFQARNFMYGIGAGYPIFKDYPKVDYYINLKGQVLSDAYRQIRLFYENMSVAMNDSGKWALMNSYGKPITDFKFDNVRSFYYSSFNPNLVMDYNNHDEEYDLIHEPNRHIYERRSMYRRGYPIMANCKDDLYFYDTLGKLLNTIPYQELKNQWFNSHHLAVLGRKNKEGKMLYSPVDSDIRELSQVKYVSFEIVYNNDNIDDADVTILDANGIRITEKLKDWFEDQKKN